MCRVILWLRQHLLYSRTKSEGNDKMSKWHQFWMHRKGVMRLWQDMNACFIPEINVFLVGTTKQWPYARKSGATAYGMDKKITLWFGILNLLSKRNDHRRACFESVGPFSKECTMCRGLNISADIHPLGALSYWGKSIFESFEVVYALNPRDE